MADQGSTRTLADIIDEIRSAAWGKCVAALTNAPPDELPNDPESRASARLLEALGEIDRRLRTLEAAPSGEMVFSSLTGWHQKDWKLHLAESRGTARIDGKAIGPASVTTWIICGAGIATVSTVRDGVGITEPTQHTPWTTDRRNWEHAPNRCPACVWKSRQVPR